MKRIFFLLPLLIIFTTGCATAIKPAFNKKTTGFNTQDESIAIFVVRTDNQNVQKHKPVPNFVEIVENTNAPKKKRLNVKIAEGFSDFRAVKDDYFVSMQLPPGEYKIRYISGFSSSFFVSASFQMPVFQEFTLRGNEVVYLGSVHGVIERRSDDSQLRAGGVLPLIDQNVAGFSNGTFKIDITDNYDQDIRLFKSKYPFLEGHEIQKRVMDAWVQPTLEEIKAK